jgi:hypothetical protein
MAERGFLDQAIEFADGVVGTLEAVGGTSSAQPSRASGFARPGHPADNRSWRIVEIVGEDCEIDYVVTDGRDEIACPTRELAEKVCRGLVG